MPYFPVLGAPLVVMPPVYELPVRHLRWCKLEEVRQTAHGIAQAYGARYIFTLENLVEGFAQLIRPNKIGSKDELEGKKIFRYSEDGRNLCGTEVPTDRMKAPPYQRFYLTSRPVYPENLYVPADWAADVLHAVRLGFRTAALTEKEDTYIALSLLAGRKAGILELPR
jgi:hypothetical protein